jgi:hypothetical protein
LLQDRATADRAHFFVAMHVDHVLQFTFCFGGPPER